MNTFLLHKKGTAYIGYCAHPDGTDVHTQHDTGLSSLFVYVKGIVHIVQVRHTCCIMYMPRSRCRMAAALRSDSMQCAQSDERNEQSICACGRDSEDCRESGVTHLQHHVHALQEMQHS